MPENFGIYTLAFSITLIVLTALDTGLNQSLLKYVSDALNKKNKKLAAANFRYLLKLKIIITCLASLLLILLSYPLSIFIFKQPKLFFPLILSSIYIVTLSIGSFYSSYFYIIKKLAHVTIKQTIFEITRILGVVIMFLIIAKEQYIIGIFGVLILSMLISTVYLLYLLKKISPFLFKPSRIKVEKKRMIRFAVYFSAIGSLLVIFGYIDTLMIGFFMNASYVGFYSAALAILTGIWGFLNISQILLPLLTDLRDDQIQKEFNKVFRYLAIISIPAIAGMVILGKYFITLIYGYEYLPSVFPFYILAVLIFEIPLIDLINPLFSAKEKPQIIIKGTIIATIVNIVLNVVFITLFLKQSAVMAIMGAALATVISQTIYIIILLAYAKKDFKIYFQYTHLIKPLFAALIMALVLTLINAQFSDMNLLLGIVEILLGMVIYFTSLYFIKVITQ